MSEIDKYVYTEDSADDGAKKGYVKDVKMAEVVAFDESYDRRQGLTPEQANRQSERNLENRIGAAVGSDVAKSEYERQRLKSIRRPKNMEQLGGDAFKTAAEADVDATEEYKAFIAKKNQDELDEIRAKIREEK
jgi:hypothetical protein